MALLKKKPVIDLSTDANSVATFAQRLSAVFADYGSSWEGECATVCELEERVAEFLGKPRALLCHSAIIANTLVVETHLNKGPAPKDKPTIVTSSDTHIASAERAALLQITGCAYLDIPDSTEKGIARLLFDDIELNGDCKLATAEVTWNRRQGAIPDAENLKDMADWSHANNMATHLDGVRLLDAAVAMDLDPAHLCRGFDTVVLGFAKGLRTQSGNVLAGAEDDLAAVEKMMKERGMFIRQGGPIAAPCLYALDRWKEWIAENHRKARDLAARLDAIDGLYVDLDSIVTNIMYVHVVDKALDGRRFKSKLEEKGIRWDRYKTGPDNAFDTEGYSRIVMHASIGEANIDYVVRTVAEVAEECR